MNRRQFFISSAFVMALAGPLTLPASAQDADPSEIVRELYAAHAKIAEQGDTKPIWLDDEIRYEFFSADLVAAIDNAYANTADGDVPPIDFDPFYNAQDWDKIGIDVADAELDGEAATVWVTVTNFGEAQELAYHMQLFDEGWRIVDIGYNPGADGFNLASILTGN